LEGHVNTSADDGAGLDGNLKCVDLSDLETGLPLEVTESRRILWRTEAWEHSTWDPKADRDSLGFPTVVRNDRGGHPDGRYYLFYAHHDPNSGIGCAVAENVGGPYMKLAASDPGREHSQVLVNPGKPGEPFHYSSPCVVWCEEEQAWFMYFHYYSNLWKQGQGHQRTALATCQDLSTNVWTPWLDAGGQLVTVFPVTAEPWMNSQSSYHAVQRLPDGRWLGFLRGTGGEYDPEGKWTQGPCTLGFATSHDGRHWDYFRENPVIHQDDGTGGRKGVYRPHFVGYLGDAGYLVCWSESQPYDSALRAVYGRTRDFRSFIRSPAGYARWSPGDGLVSPWREGSTLYLFSGKFVHLLDLPVSPLR